MNRFYYFIKSVGDSFFKGLGRVPIGLSCQVFGEIYPSYIDPQIVDSLADGSRRYFESLENKINKSN